MRRIHAMIVAVALAETTESDNARRQDPSCYLRIRLGIWVETDVQIRDKDKRELHYAKIILPPPVNGKHKFGHCKQLYTDVHKLIAQREWAQIDNESRTRGTTWMELFALFDSTASVKDPEAAARAKKRKPT